MSANNCITELTEQEARLLDLKFVHKTLLEAQQQSPGRATWLDPAIDICKQEIERCEVSRSRTFRRIVRLLAKVCLVSGAAALMFWITLSLLGAAS